MDEIDVEQAYAIFTQLMKAACSSFKADPVIMNKILTAVMDQLNEDNQNSV